MDYQLEELHSTYTKKLGYDPLDCSYISVTQKKFRQKMQSLLCKPYEETLREHSTSSVLKERDSSSSTSTIDSSASRSRHASVKRMLGPLKATRHHVSRNLLAFKTNTEIYDTRYHTSTINELNYNTDSKTLRGYLNINNDIEETDAQDYFPKSITRKLPPIMSNRMNTDQIRYYPAIVNKVDDYCDQENLSNDQLNANKSSLAKYKGRRRLILMNAGTVKSKEKNLKNYFRVDRIKLDSLYQKLQKDFQEVGEN